jgi:flavin-dependent dehydrogenase
MNRNHSHIKPRQGSSEVDIIGGSAAGLFAAYLLARGGKRVRLLDSNNVLHAPQRTLITTGHLTEVLGFDPSTAVVNRIRQIELFSPHSSARIRMDRPDLVVERAEIMRLLARKAAEEGVEILSGYKFLDLSPAEDGLRYSARNLKLGRVEEFRAGTLIGADGAFSRVARIMGADVQTAPLLQAVVPLPPGISPDTTQVWFRPEETPYFYWLIPESKSRAAFGLISDDGRAGKRGLERFLAGLGLKPVEIQAARIPLYARGGRLWKRLAGCDVYLVGDAAGQVKVTTVGGLVTGLRGARAVVDAILGRDLSYVKESRSLRRELDFHLLVRSMLNRFRGRDYDRLLNLLNHRTVKLLGLHTRDQFSSMAFRVLAAQPRLLGFAACWLRGTRKSSDHGSRL